MFRICLTGKAESVHSVGIERRCPSHPCASGNHDLTQRCLMCSYCSCLMPISDLIYNSGLRDQDSHFAAYSQPNSSLIHLLSVAILRHIQLLVNPPLGSGTEGAFVADHMNRLRSTGLTCLRMFTCREPLPQSMTAGQAHQSSRGDGSGVPAAFQHQQQRSMAAPKKKVGAASQPLCTRKVTARITAVAGCAVQPDTDKADACCCRTDIAQPAGEAQCNEVHTLRHNHSQVQVLCCTILPCQPACMHAMVHPTSHMLSWPLSTCMLCNASPVC